MTTTPTMPVTPHLDPSWPVEVQALVAELVTLRDTLTAVVRHLCDQPHHLIPASAVVAGPVPVPRWTGQYAIILRRALRLTQEGFAATLGVSVRTVATWNATPTVEPCDELQAVLDTALAKAPADAQARFRLLTQAQEHTHLGQVA